MKVTVRIDGQQYEVEIDDLYARPVVASVDGERFEVWPEGGSAVRPVAKGAIAARTASPRAGTGPLPATVVAAAPIQQADAKTVHAPIPGVIVAVNVAAGETVEVGQVLCTLEAMKMKNAIRAPRAGEIAAVHVTVGQHVQHHDPLVEFAGD